MSHNESPKPQQDCGRTPLRWTLPLRLGSSVDADHAELSLSTERGDERGRNRAALYLETKSPLERSPRVVLRQDRASEVTASPCSPRSKLLSQVNPEVSRKWGLWQPPVLEPMRLPTRLFSNKESHLWMLSLKKQQHWWVFLAWTEESFCSSYSPHADSAQQLSSSVLFLSQGFLKHHF